MKRPRKSAVSILNSWNDLRQSRLYAKATKCSFFSKWNWISGVYNQFQKSENRIWDILMPFDIGNVVLRGVIVMFRSSFMLFYTSPSRSRPITLQTMNNNRSTSLPHRFSDTTNRIRTEYNSMVDVQLSFPHTTELKLNGIARSTTRKWWQSLWVLNFEHWRHCLDGAINITVYTDHHNSKFFMFHTRSNVRLAGQQNITLGTSYFIEKEPWTHGWSIRFSATRPSNRDIKSMRGKLDMRLQVNE